MSLSIWKEARPAYSYKSSQWWLELLFCSVKWKMKQIWFQGLFSWATGGKNKQKKEVLFAELKKIERGEIELRFEAGCSRVILGEIWNRQVIWSPDLATSGLEIYFGESLVHRGYFKPLRLHEFTEGVNCIEKYRVLSFESWISTNLEFRVMGRKPAKMNKP